VIVDPHFDGDLSALLSRGPVWMVRSPSNDVLVQGIRAHPALSKLLTDFDGGDGAASSFDEIFCTVDLHHGEHSQKIPWQRMHVIGLRLDEVDHDSIKEEFEFPVTVEPETSGFCIRRTG